MSKDKQYRHLINSTKWTTLRNYQLRKHPLCQRCEEQGRLRLANEVHHIIPIESVSNQQSMQTLAYDANNLMSVCRQCHHEIHAEMQSHTKHAVKENNDRKTKMFLSQYLK